MFLRDWLPWRSRVLTILHEDEGPPGCKQCRCGSVGEFRCQDCYDTLLLCKQCCLKVHQFLPTHRISLYASGHWENSSLTDIGHIWYLGHGGNPCRWQQTEPVGTWEDGLLADAMDIDNGTPEENYTQIMVVDSNGIMMHSFHFCTCEDAEPKVEQLCRAHLFPSSYDRIQTVFTFDVLDAYLLESTECKISGNAFWSKLQSKTSHAFPDEVPVSHEVMHS